MIQGLNADVPVKILTFNRTSAYVLKDIFLKLTHIKISIILMKKNFQGYAVAHSVAFYVYIVEVGSLLLWKFGLGSYSRFKIHWCLAPQFAV